MANVVKGERPLFRVRQITRNEGGTTRTTGQQALIAAAVEAHTTHLVPHDLINGVVEHLNHTGNVHGGQLGPSPTLTGHAVRQIADQVRIVPRIHMSYYMALLNAMQDVLNSPGVAAKSVGSVPNSQPRRGRPDKRLRNQIAASRAVTLHLKNAGSYRLNNKTVTLVPGNKNQTWMPLRRSTVRLKRDMPQESRVFWRHTGRLSRVFNNARRSQLSGLTAEDFIAVNQGQPIFTDSERKRLSKGKFAAEVKLQFKVGIPRWKNKSENYMDTIVTDTFAGDAPGPLGGFFRTNDLHRDSSFRTAIERLEALRAKSPNKRIEGNFYKLYNVNSKENGLRRILAPEFRRPWLRRLSSTANKAMKAELRNLYR